MFNTEHWFIPFRRRWFLFFCISFILTLSQWQMSLKLMNSVACYRILVKRNRIDSLIFLGKMIESFLSLYLDYWEKLSVLSSISALANLIFRHSFKTVWSVFPKVYWHISLLNSFWRHFTLCLRKWSLWTTLDHILILVFNVLKKYCLVK